MCRDQANEQNKIIVRAPAMFQQYTSMWGKWERRTT